MTYRGRIKDGVAVLDGDVKLPEGTQVIIQPAEQPDSLAYLLRDVAGKGTNLPADGSLQHDHYIYGTQEMRM